MFNVLWRAVDTLGNIDWIRFYIENIFTQKHKQLNPFLRLKTFNDLFFSFCVYVIVAMIPLLNWPRMPLKCILIWLKVMRKKRRMIRVLGNHKTIPIFFFIVCDQTYLSIEFILSEFIVKAYAFMHIRLSISGRRQKNM